MLTQLTCLVISLEPGQACALPRRGCQTICALDHALWLSQQGRLDDVVVAAGDCVTLPGRGLIVAQALAERVSFRIAYPATWRQRFLARLGGSLKRSVAAAERLSSVRCTPHGASLVGRLAGVLECARFVLRSPCVDSPDSRSRVDARWVP